jgi:uncharacterized protein YjbI with pentapeptide repeats
MQEDSIMLFEIKNRFNGSVLFSLETDSFKLCVEAAVKARANLYGADLTGANLSRANLSGANLYGADLSRANLYGANLYGADLTGADLYGADLHEADLYGANLTGANLSRANLSRANLYGADLSRANLYGANLTGANLTGANLSRANLSRANLYGADLSGAYLSGANLSRANLSRANLSRADLRGATLDGADLSRATLSRAENYNPYRTDPLSILLDQPSKIRAYKLVKGSGEGPYNGGIFYEIGKSYEVLDANTSITEQCGAGINLATLPWCMREWRIGYRILLAEFTAEDIACIPHGNDGKFRVFRCKIVGEKNLEELGLVS